MKNNNLQFRSACPVSTALDIFGDKWSLLIIRDMIFKGKSTYGEFIDSEEKIATNILADRLSQLEGAGIITRRRHPESKAKILYLLSEKGIDLVPLLVEVITWSEKHHNVHPYATQFVNQLKKDKKGVIQKLMHDLKKSNLL